MLNLNFILINYKKFIYFLVYEFLIFITFNLIKIKLKKNYKMAPAKKKGEKS